MHRYREAHGTSRRKWWDCHIPASSTFQQYYTLIALSLEVLSSLLNAIPRIHNCYYQDLNVPSVCRLFWLCLLGSVAVLIAVVLKTGSFVVQSGLSQIALCSPGWPGRHNPHDPAFPILGLQASTITISPLPSFKEPDTVIYLGSFLR